MALRVPGIVDKSPDVMKGDKVVVFVDGEWELLKVGETGGELVTYTWKSTTFHLESSPWLPFQDLL